MSRAGWNKLGMIGMALIIMAASSCRPDIRENRGELKYFDLKGYFQTDTAHLNHQHGQITKTVTHNGVTETKKVNISDWGREFDLFINSDINKPAWRQSYAVQNGQNVLIYVALTPDLKTRRMVIRKDGNKIRSILIYNHTKNLLYETIEKLSYFPDSLYQIDRSQKVRLMGKNIYSVKGSFR